MRKRNLVRCFEAALAARIDTIWIARDLGYRGGRRTGIPLTDEIHLSQAGVLLGGIALDRATRGPVLAERTAAIIWSVLSHIGEPAVLWNIFPLQSPWGGRSFFEPVPHPRRARRHLAAAGGADRDNPAPRIVAIGRDAGMALAGIEIPVQAVRHPSYGGQAEFIAGVHEIYGFVDNRAREETLELPLAGGHAAIGGAPN